jgi:hypothetical protein
VNAWKMFLPVAAVATVAMVPQDPKPAEPAAPQSTQEPAPQSRPEQSAIVAVSEVHYLALNSTERTVVPAKNIVEIRLVEDRGNHIRLELSYENGDYSLIEAQAFHLLRNTGQSSRPVKLVRGNADGMRFPRNLVVQ